MSSFYLKFNGLRVGDVALCCACGKAISLARCYLLPDCQSEESKFEGRAKLY
jgi:RNA polymerase-binding transcription factor DksA